MQRYCAECGSFVDKKTLLCPQCDSAEIKRRKKKKSIFIIITSFLLCVTIVVSAIFVVPLINKSSDNNEDLSDSRNNGYNSFSEAFTDIVIADENSALDAVESVASSLGIVNVDEELEISDVSTHDGDTYYCMQRHYKGIPILGNNVIVAAYEDGTAAGLIADYFLLPSDFDVTPEKSLSEAKSAAIMYLGYDSTDLYSQINGELALYEKDENNFVLVYYLNVADYGHIIVDANTNDVIMSSSYLNPESIEVKAGDGSVTATGSKDKNGYFVLENEKYSIEIFDMNGTESIYDTTKDLKAHYDLRKYENVDVIRSKNNSFNKKAVIALDTVTMLADYYKQEHNHKGFDDVNVGIEDVFEGGNNAFGGSCIEDGKSICTIFIGINYDYSNINTICHEYGHGVLRSIKPDFMGTGSFGKEYDAVNEGYADILGEFSQSYIKRQMGDYSGVDWETKFRNIRDPQKDGLPATMQQVLDAKKKSFPYYNLTIDGRVNPITKNTISYAHFSSLVVSHSAYLMWNGIDGKSAKIGDDVLEDLWYKSMYLLPDNCSFAQMRKAVETTAQMMLKKNKLSSSQYETVVSAFDKVGIEKSTIVLNEFDLVILNRDSTEQVNVSIEVLGAVKGTSQASSLYKKELTSGRHKMNLEDGTYLIRITDLNNNSRSNTKYVRITVDGGDHYAVSEHCVHTDFGKEMHINTPDDRISPEEAVDIYMANYEVWSNGDVYAMRGYDYILMDFNFDGILELVCSVRSGSGNESENTIYTINPETEKIEEIPLLSPKAKGEGGFGYYITDDIRLLKNRNDNSMMYYCKTYARVSTNEGSLIYGKSYMNNGGLYEEKLFREDFCKAGTYGNAEDINEYCYRIDDHWEYISKGEYDEMQNDFFDVYKDQNVNIKVVNGDNFEYRTTEEQKREMLLEAYYTFSYDGFTFGEMPKQAQQSNQIVQSSDTLKNMPMVDYKGMTINEVAEIWGSDYEVADYLIGGGWGVVGYTDGRCPYLFCFKISGTISMPPVCTGAETLAGIVVHPKSDYNKYMVTDDLSVVCTYQEVLSKLNGEEFENLMDEEYGYSCDDIGGASAYFGWKNKSNPTPAEITITFKNN